MLLLVKLFETFHVINSYGSKTNASRFHTIIVIIVTGPLLVHYNNIALAFLKRKQMMDLVFCYPVTPMYPVSSNL